MSGPPISPRLSMQKFDVPLAHISVAELNGTVPIFEQGGDVVVLTVP